MADTNNVAQYTEEAVGAGHPSKAQVIDRHSTACHDDFGRHKWVDGGNVASASSISVPDDANYFTVTGTTTVTAIASTTAGSTAIDTGVVVKVKFSGALTLTHNATSFILPQGQNLSITAGDFCEFIHLGSGNWACLSYSGFATTDQAYRRRLNVNGGFGIWQRGTSSTSSGVYGADRYKHYCLPAGGSHTIAQVTATSSSAPGVYSWWKNTRTVGDTNTTAQYLYYAFTTAESVPLRNKTLTFSLYGLVGAGYAGGNLSMVLYYGTGSDQSPGGAWTGGTTLATASHALTTSAAQYSVTATVPATATQLLAWVQWTPSGTAIADDYVQLSGWQVEEGTVATQFETWLPDQEKALCVAHFNRVVSGNNAAVGQGGQTGTTVGTHKVEYPEMRTTPTLAYSNLSHFACNIAGTVRTPTAIAIGNAHTKGAFVDYTYTATAAGGYAVKMYTVSASATLDFDASL